MNFEYSCHLCNSKSYSLLHNKGRHGKVVFNYICNCCGFIFILPRPTLKEQELCYKENNFSIKERGFSSPNDSKFTQCEIIAKSRYLILEPIIDKYFNQSDESNKYSILDVGCGTGSFLRFMKARNWDVIGLEPDQVYAQAAKERYGINIFSQFVEEFRTKQKFNIITSFHVIEHIDNPNKFLNSISSLLDDNGYLFLECPSIDRWYGENIDYFFWDVHVNTFSEKTLIAFANKAEFEIVNSGWNGIGLWIIAQKCRINNLSLQWDNPERIKTIVDNAISLENNKNANKFSYWSQKFLTLGQKTLRTAQKSPLELPKKVFNKVYTKFKPNTQTLNSIDAENIALTPERNQNSVLKIAHVGLHGNGNAGDTLLFPVVRWLFQKQFCPIEFSLIQLREPVTEETIKRINNSDALLIGGGGLFLCDSNQNELSGWQWACPIQLLEKIKVPVIIFAVGYNRFREQEDFSNVFYENIAYLFEKSIFIGIRNQGSIRAICNYLPSHLHNKIKLQPCPTTILQHFYPNLPTYPLSDFPRLAVNIAFDRHHLRFGQREDQILWSVADGLIELQKQGWNIQLYNHNYLDEDARIWFKARGLYPEEVQLGNVPPNRIIEEYTKCTIALGMRGHAQMIPFGLGKPIFSLISHDKLQFFLDDIGHSDWGVEMNDSDLKEKIVSNLLEITNHYESYTNYISEAQNVLWNITLNNLSQIKSALKI